jgi:phage tail-like protein
MALATFDAAPAYSFICTIDGLEVPLVTEISGLNLEVDKITLNQQTKEGKFVTTQTMGRQKPGTFTCTRGLTKSKTMVDWMKTVWEGDLQGARKTASVSLLDHKGEVVLSYNFTNCWISKIEVSTLKAAGTENITEKSTICFDGATVS